MSKQIATESSEKSLVSTGGGNFQDQSTFKVPAVFPSDVVQQPHVGIASEGHVFMTLPPGAVVSGDMAAAAAAEVKRLAGEHKVKMLLDLTGVESITRGARSVFSGAESLRAVAVLGVSPVDRVIANFLLGGAVQPCPTRYFSTERDALTWLEKSQHDA